MRAEMKLATGVVPVALGVAMALMSGMAKAEEKAAQPLTNAVSAQTTLPSVGHRQDWRIMTVITSAYVTFYTNTDWLWVVGDAIAYSSSMANHDPDNAFGANEDIRGWRFFCKKYKVAPNGHEEFLGEFADCGNIIEGRYLHRATEADIGYRFKFVTWWVTSPSTTPGYTANPSTTSEYVFMSPPVSDLFHFNKLAIVTNNQNISAADNKREITTTVKDVDDKPVRGLNITYHIPSQSGATVTPSVDNGDGSYTTHMTMSNPALVLHSFDVSPIINGVRTSARITFYPGP